MYMKNFFKKYKSLLLILLYIEISFLPTQILFFYRNREFLDIGMLLTSILVIAFTAPVYNVVKKYSNDKKGLE